MVYKKTYRKRKPMPRSRWQNYAGAGKQLYKDVKLIKQLINVEKKHVDFQGVQSPGWTGALTTLNLIAQGDTDSFRDGDSLKMQKLRINVQMTNVRIAIARVMVIFDPNNKCVNPNDILQPVAVGTADAPIAFKDYDKRFNCRVLYDKRFLFDAVSNNNRVADIKLHIGKHTQFEAGTTVINSGALKLLVIGDAAAALTTFRINSRLTYTDN